jgi:hypothetical protein
MFREKRSRIKMFKLKLLYNWIFAIVFSGCLGYASSQENKVPSSIIEAFKKGNSTELAKFFNSNIEMLVKEREAVYSKVQAELIIKNFFLKNKPKTFEVISETQTGENNNVIGRLITQGQIKFRVVFLIIYQNDTLSINQLKIEPEEN